MFEKSKSFSWIQMSAIQIGGAICLPVLMVGQAIGQIYGFAYAVASIIIGNVLLFGLGILKAKMSFENKKITIENAVDYFGAHGSKLLALNLIVSLVAWFALQLDVISLSVQQGLRMIGMQGISNASLNIILGFFMTLGAITGIRALNKLAIFSMPILIWVIFYTLGYSLLHQGLPSSSTIDSLKGISLVLSAALLAVVDIPTYYRFSRSIKDSWLSIFITFVVALPLIEIAGVVIGRASEGTVVDALTAHGGFVYQIFILLFLVLAGWTTNNANIYSAAVTLEDATRLSLPKATLLLGSIGTFLSCFDLLSHFEKILSAMTIFTSAMGAVIAACYSMKLLGINTIYYVRANFVSWFLGVFVGFSSLFSLIHLSGVAIIDAFISSSIMCCVLTYFLR